MSGLPEMLRAPLVRFFLVGGMNTAFSFGLYVLLVWLGLHFAAANLCATIAGIVFSFRTQGSLVFDNREWRRLLRFVPVWGLIYLVNIGLIALLIRFGFDPYGAGALALVPVVAMSYLLQKFFVFAPSQRQGGDPEVAIRRP